MLHQPIDRDTAAVLPIGHDAIRHALALMAAGLDARFVRAGGTLAITIDTIDRLIAGLDGVVAALDPERAGGAVADLRRIAAELNVLPAVQAERAAGMTAIAGTGRALRDDVVDMHQMLRILSIYGMNIKIAAAGETQFVGFVDGMGTRLGFGERELAGFLTRLKDLTAAVATSQQSDRMLAAECAKVVPAVPERLAADATELEAHLGKVGGIAGRVGTIARHVQGRIAVILGALQVGDSTRQRLEHAVSALQMLDACGLASDGAAARHVRRLLSAQTDAAAADFVAQTDALIASLGDIVPSAGELSALIAEQAGEDGRAFLLRLEQGIGEVERLTAQLRTAQASSNAMTVVIADAVSELTGRIDSVERIKLDVQDIATNTRLLCRRHGTIGKAVAVIATEVDMYATSLGRITRDVASTIQVLGGIDVTLRSGGEGDGAGGGRDTGETLANALSIIRHACQQSDGIALQGSDDATQLIALLEQVAMELAGEAQVGTEMSAAAVALRGGDDGGALSGHDDDPALRELLVAIGGLYTMAQERETHAAFLLPGMDVTPAASIDDEDDDDGLF